MIPLECTRLGFIPMACCCRGSVNTLDTDSPGIIMSMFSSLTFMVYLFLLITVYLKLSPRIW